jgi:hypothetical protein
VLGAVRSVLLGAVLVVGSLSGLIGLLAAAYFFSVAPGDEEGAAVQLGAICTAGGVTAFVVSFLAWRALVRRP